MISGDTIINLLSSYQLPAIFIGSFFFGESVIIPAAFLAGQGFWSPINVFWISLVGTITSDSLWFFFGRRILIFFHRWKRYEEKSAKLFAFLENITGKKPFLSLLFIKFLYGTRILTIIYLSIRQLKFLKFVVFNAMGSAIWLIVTIPIVWLAGKGTANFIPFLDKLGYVILLLILIILAFRFGAIWLTKKIIKE